MIKDDEIDEQEPAIDGRSFFEDRHRRAFEASMLLLVCATVAVALVSAVVLGAIGLMSMWMRGPWF